MNTTMNQYQKAYLQAKALADTLSQQCVDLEKKYLREHPIVNPDGDVATVLYAIEDEQQFNTALDEFDALLKENGDLNTRYCEAKEALFKAENDLIAYGLSILPAPIRAKFTDSALRRLLIREKFIDLVLRLDTSTIPPEVALN